MQPEALSAGPISLTYCKRTLASVINLTQKHRPYCLRVRAKFLRKLTTQTHAQIQIYRHTGMQTQTEVQTDTYRDTNNHKHKHIQIQTNKQTTALFARNNAGG